MDGSGAFELKLAWRILKPARTLPAAATTRCRRRHGPGRQRRAGRTEGHSRAGRNAYRPQDRPSPQWIWSTFEQVDNIDVDQVAHPNFSPSFFDPNCWMCAVNQEPARKPAGLSRERRSRPGGPSDPERQAGAERPGSGGARTAREGQRLEILSADRHAMADGPELSLRGRNTGLPEAVANKPAASRPRSSSPTSRWKPISRADMSIPGQQTN